MHLRQALPEARVIHELAANGCRIDVAAVTQDRLYFFELKSERDKLERLPSQVKHFALCSHATFVVLHAKWFDRTPHSNGSARCASPLFDGSHLVNIWAYPINTAANTPQASFYDWLLPHQHPRVNASHPIAQRMLGLLHKPELLTVADLHGLRPVPTTNVHDLIETLALELTGRQVVRAVCQHLRQRRFAYADPPAHDQL